MIICRAKPMMKYKKSKGRSCGKNGQKSIPFRVNAFAGTLGKGLDKRSANHGGAQSVKSALGPAHHMGIAQWPLRLSGNADPLRPYVAGYPVDPVGGIKGSRHRWVRPGRGGNPDPTGAKIGSGPHGAGCLGRDLGGGGRARRRWRLRPNGRGEMTHAA